MSRSHSFERKTKETNIKGTLNLDGKGKAKIKTGIGFLDHMLELFTFHASFDLTLTCQGDLEVCPHHSVEDIGLALGEALSETMGEKKGIKRFATEFLAMDETLSRTVIDISGRPYHIFIGEFTGERIGELPTEMIKHFFHSISVKAQLAIHQEILYGENDHHKAESLFKGFGRCLGSAVTVTSNIIPSTKGVL